jgi:hypothetical protein
MLSRFFRNIIALAALVISALWALTYSRPPAGRGHSWLWEVAIILTAVVLVAVWVLCFARDPATWVAAGRTMGFKSVYSERLPRPPFALPEHIADVLGRTGPEFDLYLAHRCQQLLVSIPTRTLATDDDRDSPPLFDNTEKSLTEPYPVETFALIHSRKLMLPRFQLMPEGIMDKLLDRVDVDFDSHPKFSRRYRLWGWSEPEIRQFFNPALLDFLAERPGWSLDGDGGWLLLHQENRLVSAQELAGFVREVLELHAALADACA